jgi:hypothetical protein
MNKSAGNKMTIHFIKKSDAVRTLRTNSLFAKIPLLARDIEENKKGNSKKNCLQPHSVPETGFFQSSLSITYNQCVSK